MLTESQVIKLAKLHGKGYQREFLKLAELASQVQEPYQIVELGSYCCKSTIYMATANPVVSITAIDLWRTGTLDDTYNYEDFLTKDYFYELAKLQTSLYGVDHQITMVESSTQEQAKHWKEQNIGLLYVDADHSYEACKEDILNWMPFVRPGGVIAVHDYHEAFRGVIKAVDEVIVESGNFYDTELTKTLFTARKK